MMQNLQHSSSNGTAIDAEGERWRTKHSSGRSIVKENDDAPKESLFDDCDAERSMVKEDDDAPKKSLFDDCDAQDLASSVMSDAIDAAGNDELLRAFRDKFQEQKPTLPARSAHYRTDNYGEDDTAELSWYQRLWRSVCGAVKSCVNTVKGWLTKAWNAIKKFLCKARDKFTEYIKWLVSEISVQEIVNILYKVVMKMAKFLRQARL